MMHWENLYHFSAMKLVGMLLLLAFGNIEAYKSYSGYQVLRTSPLDRPGDLSLPPLLSRNVEVLGEPRVGRALDVLVPPEHAAELRDELDRLGLRPSVHVRDLGPVVARERAEIERLRRTEKKDGRIGPNLDRFMELNEIDEYLDSVVAAHPTIATLIPIGQSYEGRTMRVLKLSTGPGKPGIWVESGIHACEWAGPPTAMNAINELTENLATNQAMLDKNDFYFIVVANPDGYLYSWTDQRFWRKTRAPNKDSLCVGTDPNRNWDWHWRASNDMCSVNYPGTGPFSAVEVKNMAVFLTFNTNISAFFSLHSFGQLMLYPWGDVLDLPPNNEELNRIGTEAAAALEAVRGTKYTVGSVANVLYTGYGGNTDWALGGINIQTPFVIELPAGGSVGFDLPPSEIRAVAAETWEALKVLAKNAPSKRGEASSSRAFSPHKLLFLAGLCYSLYHHL